jgi:hypothetical protein
LAALAYPGAGWGDLRDAVLEIGAASFPLLFIPLVRREAEEPVHGAAITRSGSTIALAAAAYALFIATLGRGIGP